MMRKRSIYNILAIVREYAEIILLCMAGIIFLRLLISFNPLDLTVLFMIMILLASLLIC